MAGYRPKTPARCGGETMTMAEALLECRRAGEAHSTIAKPPARAMLDEALRALPPSELERALIDALGALLSGPRLEALGDRVARAGHMKARGDGCAAPMPVNPFDAAPSIPRQKPLRRF